MNEELENVLYSSPPKNQGENTIVVEPELSVVGIIFNVLAWLNLIVGVILLIGESTNFNQDYTFGFALIGSSLFLFAVASCLKFLAKISSRMGRIMRAVEK